MSSAAVAEVTTGPGAPETPRGRGHRHGSTRTRWYVVVGFMSLFIVGFGVFILYPMVMVFYYSFTNFKVGSLQPVHFVGLQNYIQLASGTVGQLFWKSVGNTLWMVVILVPVETIWAILVAGLVNSFKRASGIYRTIFFLGSMVAVVAAALSWMVMMNPAGPINHALAAIGIKGPLWFGDPAWAKPTLVMMATWMIGNMMVIFCAALLDVPKQLYEAAEIDGAGTVHKFISVTLPSISPVIFFAVITEVIYTFQYFTQAYVISTAGHSNLQTSITIGQPQNSLYFYTTMIYQQGFMFFKTNTASALAVLLFIVILIITIIFIRASRDLIYYQGATN